MSRIIASILILLLGCWGLFCSLEKPAAPDGTMQAKFVVVDTSGILIPDSLSRHITVPNAEILMSSIEYDILLRDETYRNGVYEIKNALASTYRISVYKYLSSENMLDLGRESVGCLLAGSMEIVLDNSRTESRTDTI